VGLRVNNAHTHLYDVTASAHLIDDFDLRFTIYDLRLRAGNAKRGEVEVGAEATNRKSEI